MLSTNVRSHEDLAPDDFVEIPAEGDSGVGMVESMATESASSLRGRGVSHAYLDAVRDVALFAAGGDIDAAHMVSKGEWDAVREEAGFAEMPTAESVRQKLRITHWRSVLAVVFLPAEQRRQGLGTYAKRVSAYGRGAALPGLVATPVEREQIEQLLAEDDLAELPMEGVGLEDETEPGGHRLSGPSKVVVLITSRALRTVMFRVSHSPAAKEYDIEVRQLEDGRRREKLPLLGFPTSDAIVKKYGSWLAAFEACGLEPPVPFRQLPGAPLVEVIDACVDFWGVLPSYKRVQAFAKACDIALEYRGDDPWDVTLARVRHARADRGLETPGRSTRAESRRLRMPTLEEAEAIRERLGNPLQRRKLPWTVEEAHDGLRIYRDEHLGPNDRPTVAHYGSACRKDKRLVWPSSLKKTTGKSFTQLMAEEGM